MANSFPGQDIFGERMRFLFGMLVADERIQILTKDFVFLESENFFKGRIGRKNSVMRI